MNISHVSFSDLVLVLSVTYFIFKLAYYLHLKWVLYNWRSKSIEFVKDSISDYVDFNNSKITNLGNLESIGGYVDFRNNGKAYEYLSKYWDALYSRPLASELKSIRYDNNGILIWERN